MEAKDAFAWMKADLAGLLERGVELVPTRALMDAVARQESSAPQVSQLAELEHSARTSAADRKHKAELEMFKAVIESGKTALTTVMLVNGGAAVALLAFIANMAAKVDSPIKLYAIAGALMWFVMGVLLAALATGTTYLTQSAYAEQMYGAPGKPVSRWVKIGIDYGDYTAIGLVFLAYCAFAAGAFTAYRAFGG